MRLFRSHLRFCLWLALTALLATRVADAHWHVCFDGQEPPANVHMADGGLHHDADHEDSEHNDKDIHILGISVAKQGHDSADIPAFITTASLSLELYLPRDTSAIPQPSPSLTHPPPRLRPPLRGPPT